MARSTLSFVWWCTPERAFSTRSTVAVLSPAWAAICLMVSAGLPSDPDVFLMES